MFLETDEVRPDAMIEKYENNLWSCINERIDTSYIRSLASFAKYLPPRATCSLRAVQLCAKCRQRGVKVILYEKQEVVRIKAQSQL